MIEDSDVVFLMLVVQFSYEGEVFYSINKSFLLKDELSKDAYSYMTRVVVIV